MHPKPDFNGHFLGDGFLLCNLTGSFLSKGASVEFVNIVELLLAQCVLPSSIKLTEELMCKEVECAAGAASQVKVVGAVTSCLS